MSYRRHTLMYILVSMVSLLSPLASASGICPVTISEHDRFRYGNEYLSTTLWSLGVIIFSPDGPGVIYPDGSLGMKWHWERHITGQFQVQGRRLDAEAPPLRVRVLPGYGNAGFIPTGLVFPGAGCWEVTGKIGKQSLTFTTLVVDLCEYGALCDETSDDASSR